MVALCLIGQPTVPRQDQLTIFAHDNITSQRPVQGEDVREFVYEAKPSPYKKGHLRRT